MRQHGHFNFMKKICNKSTNSFRCLFPFRFKSMRGYEFTQSLEKKNFFCGIHIIYHARLEIAYVHCSTLWSQ